MNNLLVTVALALIIVSPHSATTPREVAPSVVAQPNPSAAMIQFVNKEGEFSVKLPSEPKASTQEVDTAVGKVTMHMFTVETNSGATAFMVIYSDYPSALDPATAVDGAITGEVGSFKGKIVADKKVTLNGWPGRTVTIEGADVNCLSSAYMAGNRLYQVMFATSKGEAIPSDGTDFIASFQITKSAPAK
jgi:hypothetical protein